MECLESVNRIKQAMQKRVCVKLCSILLFPCCDQLMMIKYMASNKIKKGLILAHISKGRGHLVHGGESMAGQHQN